MRFARTLLVTSALALAAVGQAQATVMSARIEVTALTNGANPTGTFTSPIFTFRNTSADPVDITGAEIFGSIAWDYVILASVLNPAGGTRSLVSGQESATNPNDGCTNSIEYGLTSFNPGDSFQFRADPDGPPGCSNAAIDIQPFLGPLLSPSDVSASVTFSTGDILTGNVWNMQLINPQGSQSANSNKLYFMDLRLSTNSTSTSTSGGQDVPEPASMALLGAGLAALGLARRKRG